MGRRRFTWIQGGQAAGGAAVLYSILGGGVREFWIKADDFDVKIAEFENVKTLRPTFSWGENVGDTLNSSATASAGINQSGSNQSSGSAFFPAGTGAELSLFVSGTLLSGGTDTKTGDVQSTRTNNPRLFINSANPADSGTGNVTLFGPNPNGSNTDKGRVFQVGVSLFTSRSTGSAISWSGSTVHTIQSIATVERTTPYEAWLSATLTSFYVIIKYLEDSLDLFDQMTENETFDRLRVIRLDLSGAVVSNEFHQISNLPPANPDNWRDLLGNYRTISNQDSSSDSCIDLFNSDDSANLAGGQAYLIPLSQVVNGQALRSRLQTSPNTVAAILTTQTVTSGATCTLGTAAESTVQVPSPGRGTVEGITYLP